MVSPDAVRTLSPNDATGDTCQFRYTNFSVKALVRLGTICEFMFRLIEPEYQAALANIIPIIDFRRK